VLEKSIPIGKTGESCQVDGTGKVYVNIQSSNEVIEIDAASNKVTRRASVLPCEGPRGLAIDVKGKKLLSVCNKVMAVTDIPTFKVVDKPAIGNGPDSAGFDSGMGLAFSSNGDGTLSIVKQTRSSYDTVGTVKTERGARTMCVDEKMHRVYLLAAEYGETKPGEKRGAAILPDSFHILVVGK
jgi:DNA-binding beta-propeller fold protein YncE